MDAMNALIVIDQKEDWPFEIPGAAVLTARSYLAQSESGLADAPVDAFEALRDLCVQPRSLARSVFFRPAPQR